MKKVQTSKHFVKNMWKQQELRRKVSLDLFAAIILHKVFVEEKKLFDQ